MLQLIFIVVIIMRTILLTVHTVKYTIVIIIIMAGIGATILISIHTIIHTMYLIIGNTTVPGGHGYIWHTVVTGHMEHTAGTGNTVTTAGTGIMENMGIRFIKQNTGSTTDTTGKRSIMSRRMENISRNTLMLKRVLI